MGISVHFRDESVANGSLLKEFKKGNFVVKWNENKFDQVSPDHSLEWLNGIGKRGGGIIGITKTSSALSTWALSYNLRSQTAENTHTLFRLHQEDKFSHNQSTPGRKVCDNKDERSCSPFSRSSKYFYHKNIQPIFITLPLKISSPMKFKSRY